MQKPFLKQQRTVVLLAPLKAVHLLSLSTSTVFMCFFTNLFPKHIETTPL